MELLFYQLGKVLIYSKFRLVTLNFGPKLDLQFSAKYGKLSCCSVWDNVWCVSEKLTVKGLGICETVYCR